ncbi:CRE-LPR-5 protein [Aphelenchoides avenae]|nr:CRE-LPR-5 protein [Aphelenchus avenae]
MASYFSDPAVESFVRTLTGPGMIPPRTYEVLPPVTRYPPDYPMPEVTPVPKTPFLNALERGLEYFLSGGYQPPPERRLPTLLEEDHLLKNSFSTNNEPQTVEKEEEIEGSGQESATTKHSSIAGIPTVMPNIPKVPVDVQKALKLKAKAKFTDPRPAVPDGGFEPPAEIRRHPGFYQRTAEQFQYDSKPAHKQGLVSSMLEYMGMRDHPLAREPAKLDTILTDMVLDSVKNLTGSQVVANAPMTALERFVSQSNTPLCHFQPQSVEQFNVAAFMGQWYQVMHSPLMSSSACSMMNYDMLSLDRSPHNVGSVFQTVELSTNGAVNADPTFASGYAMVAGPGHLVYHKLNQAELDVRVIALGETDRSGRYQYAVLAVNCNYPLYVIARDPEVFRQRYSAEVQRLLEEKGLVNSVSRFLNIITPIHPALCAFPKNIFPARR